MGTTEREWAALKAVVLEVLDLPPEVRESHLQVLCPDPAQRAAAAALLQACERAAASPVLDLPAAEFAAPLLAENDHEQEQRTIERVRQALAGRYTIERELGSGGMARVYLARDERHGRLVALKLLRPEMLPDGGAERFQREIEFAARLSHPHILALHDSGEAGGLLYYITPYVDGESLRHRLRLTGSLSLLESVRLMRDVARALAHAHRQGLVHRDIKPANILLTQEGDALVADFGVAKGLVAAQGTPGLRDAELTDGVLLGTPAYMAPEQVTGGPTVDHRADLYALGAVAFELLTGRPPFAGRPGHEQMTAHVSERPERLSVRTDLPRALASLVDRLLAKDPDDRPQGAAEVVRVLDEAVAGLSPTGRSTGRAGRAPLGRALIVASALGVVGLAWWGGPDRDGASAATGAAERRLAVLPFAPGGGTLEDSAFGEGLTDELVRTLGAMPGLRVARPPAAALARRDLDVRAVEEMMGVEAVLEGRLHREGERTRVLASLKRAGDGTVLWSKDYQVKGPDLFALQEEVARDVTAVLLPGHPVPPDRVSGRGTEDYEAYELYLKGRHLVNTRQRDGLLRALEYFDEALARDPDYARAHAAAADAWTFLGIFGHVRPRQAFPRALAEAERAIRLDSLVVEGHATLAHLLFVYEWNWAEARAALKRAIDLDPRYPMLRMYYASYLHSVGRPSEALAQLDVAKKLDPLIATGVLSGRIHVDTGEPDAAIRILREEIELDPRLDLAHQLLAHAHLQKGDSRGAIASMQRAAALSGPRDSAQLAYVYARTGDHAEARRVLDHLLDGERPMDLVGFHLAMAYAGLGDADGAFRWLEAAHAQHASFMNLLAVSTGFESVRGDPRFDDLLRRMGLR